MKKIPIPYKGETVYYSPKKIICFEGVKHFTNVYVIDKTAPEGWRKFTCTRTLKYFDKLMYDHGFQRTNKKIVLGLRRICRRLPGNLLKIDYPCFNFITVGRKYRSELKQRLELRLVPKAAEAPLCS